MALQQSPDMQMRQSLYESQQTTAAKLKTLSTSTQKLQVFIRSPRCKRRLPLLRILSGVAAAFVGGGVIGGRERGGRLRFSSFAHVTDVTIFHCTLESGTVPRRLGAFVVSLIFLTDFV